MDGWMDGFTSGYRVATALRIAIAIGEASF